MSSVISRCERCKLDRVFVRVTPLANQTSYGVEWQCRHCQDGVLDICPLGPIVPSASVCLNCAATISEPGDFAVCPACGLTRLGARDTFGLDPMPADPVTAAGRAFDAGLIRRAVATINQAIMNDPSIEQAWQVKYSFLSGLGFHEAALSVIEAACGYSSNPDLLISRGYALQMLSQHAEAIEVYRHYLSAAPDGEYTAVALGKMADSSRELNDDSAAEALYRQAIAKDPKQPDHYANYVRLLLDQKRFDEAHPLIDQGWTCAKESARVSRFLEDKSLVFAEQMRGDESLKCAEAAIKQDPKSIRAQYLRGRALALLGRLAEARDGMQAVLKLDPKNPDVRRALKTIAEAAK